MGEKKIKVKLDEFMVNEMLVNGVADDDVAMVIEYDAVDVDFSLVHVHDHDHDHEHLFGLCKRQVLGRVAVVLLRSRHVCDESQFPFPNRIPSLQSHLSGDHNK